MLRAVVAVPQAFQVLTACPVLPEHMVAEAATTAHPILIMKALVMLAVLMVTVAVRVILIQVADREAAGG
jgi:hypothetical protein